MDDNLHVLSRMYYSVRTLDKQVMPPTIYFMLILTLRSFE